MHTHLSPYLSPWRRTARSDNRRLCPFAGTLRAVSDGTRTRGRRDHNPGAQSWPREAGPPRRIALENTKRSVACVGRLEPRSIGTGPILAPGSPTSISNAAGDFSLTRGALPSSACAGRSSTEFENGFENDQGRSYVAFVAGAGRSLALECDIDRATIAQTRLRAWSGITGWGSLARL